MYQIKSISFMKSMPHCRWACVSDWAIGCIMFSSPAYCSRGSSLGQYHGRPGRDGADQDLQGLHVQLQQAQRDLLWRLRVGLYHKEGIEQGEHLCSELRRKVPENEPKGLSTLPGDSKMCEAFYLNIFHRSSSWWQMRMQWHKWLGRASCRKRCSHCRLDRQRL